MGVCQPLISTGGRDLRPETVCAGWGGVGPWGGSRGTAWFCCGVLDLLGALAAGATGQGGILSPVPYFQQVAGGGPGRSRRGKGPAFCLKAGGHLPVASWFTRRSERELYHWGRCAEGGPGLRTDRPDTEPPGPEGGLWLWPPSCCCCSVFGPGGAGSRLLVLGRWAREGQPVFSGECLGTGRGRGGLGARFSRSLEMDRPGRLPHQAG